MRAYVLEKGKLKVKDMPDPVAGKEEVVVALKFAGLNRRDLKIHQRVGDDSDAIVLGSDGAGIIESVGSGVIGVEVGEEVIINPALRWGKNSDAPPKEFDILGMPDNGTIAEKIVIASDQVEKKPANLSWEEAGVLALAALTGYRALVTKGDIKQGQTIFIPGAGSGVATYIIQFAKAKGARVIVSSRSEYKREQALKIGADIAIDTHCDWEVALANEQVDLVIDSIGAATFNRSLKILKQGGKMVVFGATTEDVVDFNIREFFYGQYQLLGSTMGSREELQDMLTFIEQENIHPIIDEVFTLNNVEEAFKLLDVNNQFGKIAIKMT